MRRFLLGLLLVVLLGGDWGSTLVAGQPETFAFLVGVRKYPPTKFKELPGAENDVTQLAQVLQERGVPKDNIVVLTHSTGAEDTRYLPLANNIRRELNLLLENRTKDDIVILALAGHGIEPPGKPYYFLPLDADLNDPRKLISIDDLYGELKTCKAKLKLLFVDACREDPLAPVHRSALSKETFPESVSMPKLADPPGGVAAFFSCSKGQLARERVDQVDGKSVSHGIFFHALIEGMGGKAEDKEGKLTVPDLEKYLKKEVETYARKIYSAKQFPDVRNQTVGLVSLFASSSAAPERPRTLTPSPSIGQPKALSVITNSIGQKLVYLPPGNFTMGSPADEPFRHKDEEQVAVELRKGFYLGQTEVTQGEWKAVMGTEPWKGKEYVKEGANFPATYVSWDNAQAFCKKLSQTEGKANRLPTEAEWEYACRGGTQTAYSFGKDASKLGDYAWYGKNAYDIDEKYVHLVGQKKANPFGLYDMHGNVYEWCADRYASKLAGGSNPTGAVQASDRVFRGGSWNDGAAYCRSANRSNETPDFRHYFVGFRVARSSEK